MSTLARHAPTAPAPPSPAGPPPPTDLRSRAEQVFRQHGPRIYNLARRMVPSEHDAQDVAQEVLLQVVRKLDEFRGESDLTTWLHRVTVNAALAHRRKRAARPQEAAPGPLEARADTGTPGDGGRRWRQGPEEQVLSRETRERLERAVAALPEMYRDVVVLADVHQLPNAEVAALLGVGLAAVKSRLHRARRLLRDALAPYFEEVAA